MAAEMASARNNAPTAISNVNIRLAPSPKWASPEMTQRYGRGAEALQTKARVPTAGAGDDFVEPSPIRCF
jgi:hypothetical protein